jgi:hypothetical protein
MIHPNVNHIGSTMTDGSRYQGFIGDVDAHHRRVTAAGVHADPPADQDYGMRTYHVTDPEGYHWGFMQRLGTPYVQRIPTEEGGWKEILADAPD